MITTTIIFGAAVAGYRYYKSFGKESADLITYRYTGDFPDLQKLYCNGQCINLSYFDAQIKEQMIIELSRIGSNKIVFNS
uniref:Uncharacterized protein n=1 Tax=Panagrolaimus superbus TaxID=310955 RepID=A0A914XWI1_9BILA